MASRNSGIREIAIVGAGDPAMRRAVTVRLSQAIAHSVVVDGDVLRSDGQLVACAVATRTERFVPPRIAQVEETTCTGCGRCLRSCPMGALTRQDRRILVDASVCTACGACVGACFRGAIAIAPMVSVNTSVFVTPHGRVVGCDGVPEGFSMSGLVRHLRARGRREARLFGAEVVLVDVSVDDRAEIYMALEDVGHAIALVGEDESEADRMCRILEGLSGRGVRLDVVAAGGSAETLAASEVSSQWRIHRVAASGGDGDVFLGGLPVWLQACLGES